MDREFRLGDDDFNVISGIFLIHTTLPELEPLMIPTESVKLDPFEFDKQSNPEPVAFKQIF